MDDMQRLLDAYDEYIAATNAAIVSKGRITELENEEKDYIRNHETIENQHDLNNLRRRLAIFKENINTEKGKITKADNALRNWHSSIPFDDIWFHVESLKGRCRKVASEIQYHRYGEQVQSIFIA